MADVGEEGTEVFSVPFFRKNSSNVKCETLIDFIRLMEYVACRFDGCHNDHYCLCALGYGI